MPIKLSIILLALASAPCFASIGSKTAWDIQTTGASTNGGAFDPSVGSPGTDESQGSGTAITITLTGSSTGTGSPAFTSTTHGPGNFVDIASGSGCTTGRFEILSQSSGTATFDHAMGSTSNVCTGVIGGSASTPGDITSSLVGGNTIWIKAGTYSISAAIVNGNSGSGFWTGYTSSHGDATTPVATISTSSQINIFQLAGNSGNAFKNIAFVGTADGQTAINQGNWTLINDSFSGFTGTILGGTNGGTFIVNCSFTGGAHVTDSLTNVYITDSYISGTTGASLSAFGGIVLNTIITGSGNVGISTNSSTPVTVIHSDIYNSTSDGISTTNSLTLTVRNSIFYGNGGYGINDAVANTVNLFVQEDYNAYGSNTSGATNGFTARSHAQTLTGNPFVNAGGGNFALNSTAGAGALCRGTGTPGVFPGGSSTGIPDIGAVESGAAVPAGPVACGFS